LKAEQRRYDWMKEGAMPTTAAKRLYDLLDAL